MNLLPPPGRTRIELVVALPEAAGLGVRFVAGWFSEPGYVSRLITLIY